MNPSVGVFPDWDWCLTSQPAIAFAPWSGHGSIQNTAGVTTSASVPGLPNPPTHGLGAWPMTGTIDNALGVSLDTNSQPSAATGRKSRFIGLMLRISAPRFSTLTSYWTGVPYFDLSVDWKMQGQADSMNGITEGRIFWHDPTYDLVLFVRAAATAGIGTPWVPVMSSGYTLETSPLVNLAGGALNVIVQGITTRDLVGDRPTPTPVTGWMTRVIQMNNTYLANRAVRDVIDLSEPPDPRQPVVPAGPRSAVPTPREIRGGQWRTLIPNSDPGGPSGPTGPNGPSGPTGPTGPGPGGPTTPTRTVTVIGRAISSGAPIPVVPY